MPDPELLVPLTEAQEHLVERFRAQFGGAVLGAHSCRGQLSIYVNRDILADALRFARDDRELHFDLLIDVTAVDGLKLAPPGEPRFELVYNLYSVGKNHRILLKSGLPDGAHAPSATPIWSTANFLEREVYDLMGIVFDGHPNLERILTPDGWIGHPLRKNHPVRTDQFPNVES